VGAREVLSEADVRRLGTTVCPMCGCGDGALRDES